MKKLFSIFVGLFMWLGLFAQTPDCPGCRVEIDSCMIKVTKTGYWKETYFTNVLRVDYFAKMVVLQDAQQQTITISYSNVKKPVFATFDDMVAYLTEMDCVPCCEGGGGGLDSVIVVNPNDSIFLINKPLNIATCYLDTTSLDTIAITWFEDGTLAAFNYTTLLITTVFEADWVPTLCPTQQQISGLLKNTGLIKDAIDTSNVRLDSLISKPFSILNQLCYRDTCTVCDYFTAFSTPGRVLIGVMENGDTIPLAYDYDFTINPAAEALRLNNDLVSAGYDVTVTYSAPNVSISFSEFCGVIDKVVFKFGEKPFSPLNCEPIGEYSAQVLSNGNKVFFNNSTNQIIGSLPGTAIAVDCNADALACCDTIKELLRDTLSVSVTNQITFPTTLDVNVTNDSINVHLLNSISISDTVNVNVFGADTIDVNVINQITFPDTIIAEVVNLDSIITLLNIGLRLDTFTINTLDQIQIETGLISLDVDDIRISSLNIESYLNTFKTITQAQLDSLLELQNDIIAELQVVPTQTNGQNQYFQTSASGSISAGYYSYSICNVGAASGTVNDGINGNQTVLVGQCMSFQGYLNPVTNVFTLNTAMAYNATGTTFSITIKQ